MRNFRDRYPLAIEEQDGWPAFRTRAGLVTPVEVATHVLEALIARTGIDPKAAPVTVTVPAAFAAPQREATALAAAARPGSAKCGCSRSRSPPRTPTSRAGRAASARSSTTSAAARSIARSWTARSGTPALIAHTSDLTLGGDDVDHRLAAWVRHSVIEKHNWDLASYAEVYDRVLSECELAKIELATADRVEFLLGQVDPDCPAPDEPIAITRQLLDAQCRELLQRSFSACDAVLRQAGMKASDVDVVLLAGGSTLLAVVQEGVAAYFGQRGAMGIEPTEVVAIGASIAPL